VKTLSVIAAALIVVCCVGLALIRWRDTAAAYAGPATAKDFPVGRHRFEPFDARDVAGVREISKTELIKLMSPTRPLSQDEIENLNRGCPGFVCLYQGLGLRRWPEAARGTRAYLHLDNALSRRCPDGQENFVFLKQAWWEGGKPPSPNQITGEVPLLSITREKPGWYSFNYAAYFPTTATYVWINHREYGFPVNLIKPQKAYVSRLPPPIEEYRPALIYCSTCR